MNARALCFLLGGAVSGWAAIRDVPFRQPVPVHFALAPELQGATFRRLAVNREGVAYVLTDRGVARVFDDRLTLDGSFRPLAGKPARDLLIQRGEVFYLFDDQYLANGFAGKVLGHLPGSGYRSLAVAEDLTALAAGETNLAWFRSGRVTLTPFALARPGEQLRAWHNQFYLLVSDTIYRVGENRLEAFHRGKDLTTFAFGGNEMWVGTRQGYFRLDLATGRTTVPLQTNLPATEIVCLAPATNGLWAGTTRGVFFQAGLGACKYFASKRWLDDDSTIDLQIDPAGDVYVLTRAGLNRIELRPFTLAQKAAVYDRKIRQRHMRYGFCAELRLRTPGDIATAEMIDTDNDGTWSSYYLASQAFRFAVTGEEEARTNAWETFAALERLQTIHPLEGFPARTFERKGFKVSDPDRWHPAPDPNWEWKAHTSSDEITAHTFAYAVLYETVARTPQEKARIAAVYDKIVSHIVRHNYYLVDVDGQPTLWGRWNPEYVNGYPPSIVDRRLNSAEIVAFLQFAYRITGKDLYRARAFELLERHGYLQNIASPMSRIAPTPGYVYRGNDMGNEWNHSDDLLAFVNYWVLYRYAFNEDLRRLYAATIRDHWDIERIERNPLWNFVFSLTNPVDYDPTGAAWTLQTYPLDLIDYTIRNSARADLTLLEDNFRHQQSRQLLPPDERPTMRWNGNPFTLDGGNGGATELAGDEYLLPYWMGRYLRLIEPPAALPLPRR